MNVQFGDWWHNSGPQEEHRHLPPNVVVKEWKIKITKHSQTVTRYQMDAKPAINAGQLKEQNTVLLQNVNVRTI